MNPATKIAEATRNAANRARVEAIKAEHAGEQDGDSVHLSVEYDGDAIVMLVHFEGETYGRRVSLDLLHKGVRTSLGNFVIRAKRLA